LTSASLDSPDVAVFESATEGKAQRMQARNNTTAVKPARYLFFVSFIEKFLVLRCKDNKFFPKTCVICGFFCNFARKIIICIQIDREAYRFRGH
jgi:hypothetical protein